MLNNFLPNVYKETIKIFNTFASIGRRLHMHCLKRFLANIYNIVVARDVFTFIKLYKSLYCTKNINVIDNNKSYNDYSETTYYNLSLYY